MKPAGLTLIFLGCVWAGLCFSRALGERVRLLEEMKHTLRILDGEIRHAHASLPEAFAQAGKLSREPYGGFWRKAAGMTEEMDGKRLPEILRIAGEQELSGCALKAEDREILLELGERLGIQDVESQLGILALALEKAQVQTEKAREESAQKARVARYLGVLGGLFLVVLLL